MIEFKRDWFPGGVNVGTPFGWDTETFPTRGRFHIAQDYSVHYTRREKDIPRTVISGPVQFIPRDAQGNSVLRQFCEDFEVRYYHHRREEFSSDIIAALSVPGAVVEAGAPIGPVGNVGVSVGIGNDGSHEHLVIRGTKEAKDELWVILGERWYEHDLGDDWSVKDNERVRSAKGDAFAGKVREWGIHWLNENVIYRVDGMTGQDSYFLNPRAVLGA